MSTSQLTFNGPFKRAELLLLPQYAASDAFLANGKWKGSRSHLLSVERNADGVTTTEPLYCIVVGMISADKTYLGKHGNFSTKFTEDARKAKLQFTVTRPDDPEFGPDFDKAVIAFEEKQRIVSVSPRPRFFLLNEEGNGMRMNFNLFEPRNDSNDRDREKETRSYNIEHQYEPYWDSAKAGHYCCIMPVFDTNDLPIDPSRFGQKLVGAMCEITFTLRHYAIGGRRNPDGSDVPSNDVFSAQVETVAILKHPLILSRSPYKGRLTRRPHHTPQLPTRGEQVNAARAFVSTGDVDPPSSTTSTVPSLETPAHASTAFPFTSAIDAPVAVAVVPIMACAPIPATSGEPFTPNRTIDPFVAAAAISAVACADVPIPAVTTPPTSNIISTDPATVTTDSGTNSADPGTVTAEPVVIGSQDSSTSIETLTSNSGKELAGSGPPLKKRRYGK